MFAGWTIFWSPCLAQGVPGTIEQSIAHYLDSQADLSHPLDSVRMGVSVYDGRRWVMQHTSP